MENLAKEVELAFSTREKRVVEKVAVDVSDVPEGQRQALVERVGKLATREIGLDKTNELLGKLCLLLGWFPGRRRELIGAEVGGFVKHALLGTIILPRQLCRKIL